MKIIESVLTKNDCYKSGKKIAVKGLMIHSVGCNQPSAQVFINNWNKPASEQGGRQVCVHAFIEPDGDVFQTLPWNWRGWHGGGSSNDTHIGVEMTEPATIKYTGSGSAWTESADGVNTKNHVLGTYKTAVELFAYLCDMFGLDPLADGVVISHSEGYKRGIASNHGDVEHIWSRFGLTMNQFRKAIKAAMATAGPTSEPAPSPSAIKVGDIVKFKGGPHYSSAGASTPSGAARKPGLAKVTQTYNGKHPFHLVAEKGGGSDVYGWVDAATIETQTEKTPEEITVENALADGVITDGPYWLSVLTGKTAASGANIKSAFDNAHKKIMKA